MHRICGPSGFRLSGDYFNESAGFFRVRSARYIARMATGMVRTSTPISAGMLSITGSS